MTTAAREACDRLRVLYDASRDQLVAATTAADALTTRVREQAGGGGDTQCGAKRKLAAAEARVARCGRAYNTVFNVYTHMLQRYTQELNHELGAVQSQSLPARPD